MTRKPEQPTGGELIAEGKTKILLATKPDPDKVLIVSKDDITAGDGAKHDLIEGKAALATRTTCNVFRLLKAAGLPVAFDKQIDEKSFTAPLCQMLPYEVVIRREAHGSYLKRMPGLAKGQLFPRLLVEFFLKTNGRKWKTHDLLCDDPLMDYSESARTISLYEPSKPFYGQKPFLVLPEKDVFRQAEEWKLFSEIRGIARRAFLVLEKAWQLEGRTLVDFKVEFGLTKADTLLLADVIDNDSWRVLENGAYIDKQSYRDGGQLDEVAEKYRRVAGITDNFRLPVQQILIWRGSDKDDVSPVVKAIQQISGSKDAVKVTTATCSIHKEPVRGLNELHALVQQIPDTVVIAFIGRSNGAGPTLAASTTVPVITVPASFKDFPEDVWSSLRTPSNVPVTTVLEPSNAALAALEILALRNPQLHMALREQLEERLVNTVPV
ncbi:MAG: AIR carboxylase family protein [Chthoniobacterales bacterium]|nr:AIR carboxylase family protein [Chthoniobacterales bacterium]